MLTYTEKEVAKLYITLGNGQHIINKSKIAEEMGISSSTVVHTTKKLEIAGAIKCKGLGAKGSFIEIDDTENIKKYL